MERMMSLKQLPFAGAIAVAVATPMAGSAATTTVSDAFTIPVVAAAPGLQVLRASAGLPQFDPAQGALTSALFFASVSVSGVSQYFTTVPLDSLQQNVFLEAAFFSTPDVGDDPFTAVELAVRDNDVVGANGFFGTTGSAQGEAIFTDLDAVVGTGVIEINFQGIAVDGTPAQAVSAFGQANFVYGIEYTFTPGDGMGDPGTGGGDPGTGGGGMGGNGDDDDDMPPVVPLPAGGVLLVGGLVALGALRRRARI
ncbi:VPLPA-CTERM sorting domain-containing protein [Jannaschia sp. LMIT008]|uniref:VPLPA-CTERM sorting domain-containing protein n=1 Tax=Jannaschia maritima TaxID=3032585 RepID=UPI002810B6CA|nr:VPLPA-CTERM sorting domain-containing protein [Jannaschia sp. LMIT008]